MGAWIRFQVDVFENREEYLRSFVFYCALSKLSVHHGLHNYVLVIIRFYIRRTQTAWENWRSDQGESDVWLLSSWEGFRFLDLIRNFIGHFYSVNVVYLEFQQFIIMMLWN